MRDAPSAWTGGRYSDEFREVHKDAHKTGTNPDGTARNLSVPMHVPWTAGVMGASVDLSIKWETGLEGMRSSVGARGSNLRSLRGSLRLVFMWIHVDPFGFDGVLRTSPQAGDSDILWRAWETKEQNLARGVHASSIPEFGPKLVLPDGWEVRTHDNGLPYYKHGASGNTSWEPPTI